MLEEEKFKGKYRTKSMRMQGWDYASDGAYFITICVKDKEYDFGEVVNGVMGLSEIGKQVEILWRQIEEIHKNIFLDAFIVMPNHLHGIIFVGCDDSTTSVETHQWRVSTKNRFGVLPKKSISSIINHFKGVTTKWTNKNGFKNFLWQKNFYDRIIRNDDELNRIRQYIIDNPMNWEQDRNNFENLYI